MNINISPSALYNALTSVALACDKDQPNCLLATEEDYAFAVGSGHSMEYTSRNIKCEVVEHGIIGVHVSDFMNIVKGFRGSDSINVRSGDKSVIVSYQLSVYELPLIPQGEVPVSMHEQVDFDNVCTIDSDMLHDHLASLDRCAPQQDVRYTLNGINFDFSNDKLNLVATNGQIMSVAEIPVENCKGGSYTVPKGGDVLGALKKMLSTAGEEVDIGFSHNFIQVELTNGEALRGRLIDGRYVDWRRVMQPIGDDEGELVVFKRLELLNVLDRLTTVSLKTLRINLFPGQATFQLAQKAINSGTEIMMCQGNATIEFGINPTLLKDILNATCGHEEEVAIKIQSINGLIKVLARETNRIGGIMPCKL
ncbi:DNA polymerase III subunit beta [Photobacterium lutimaris]|nr:DNA polymerase III subunit beta [Photobacterium lutimaris]TDR72562.1 DNA polymerase III sliding clamp (beta) subunit (PCNA family) [Photobacterium lutimaris]